MERGRYKDALQEGWKLLSSCNTAVVTRNAEAEYKDNIYSVKFLNEYYYLNMDTEKVFSKTGDTPDAVSVLILHYLANAQNVKVLNQLVSFRELYGGEIYYGAFYNTAIQPLIAKFGASPQTLLEATAQLDAQPVEMGDAAVRIDAFPKVPVTIVIWGGDEEVPPGGNMLFDSTIEYHLSTEDVAVLGRIVCWKIVRF